ncbi:MAG: alanine racemase, partial [Chloroflexota bacterium]|nr:alanine racemase [Chloroflexota bacterium]
MNDSLYEEVTWAEIDLDAIAYNVRQLKGLIGERVELMAVVKANAYGHGAVPVAKIALENGATRLAVNRPVGGIELREAGITAPILILGYSPSWEAEAIVRYDLTPTVNEREVASALAEAASSQGKVLPIHVEVDTGMGRFGLLPEEVVSFVKGLADFPSLRLEGFWTHFAVADEADKSYTYQQFETYRGVLRRLEEAGVEIPVRHVANSAAILDLPETHLGMVRCGIAIYGLYPSPEVHHSLPLRPAVSLKSHVARVRTLPAG